MLRAYHLGKMLSGRKVVKDFSIEVRQGEVVGLLGPNGAGKTTAFHMVTGMVRPDHGEIFLDSEEITHSPMYCRARKGMGYLPQESSIFKGMTVEQNIMSILEFTEKNSVLRKSKLSSLLLEFGIEGLAHAPAIALSGGEKRRVEIARCLASNPRYIMLDEPFAGIDPISVHDIKDLIMQLKRKDLGILITDHNFRETLDVMDKIYVMHDGSILEQGDKEAIVNSAQVKKLYLGDGFCHGN